MPKRKRRKISKDFFVIGYDQGIANAGLCVMSYDVKENKKKIIYKEYFITSPREETPERILKHYNLLNKIIKRYKNNVVAIACEKLMYNPGGKANRNKSASMMIVNEISAVVMLVAAQNKIRFFEFMPMTVKKRFTGSGKATKEDIIKRAIEKYRLRKVPIEHTADAIAIADTLCDEILKNGLE